MTIYCCSNQAVLRRPLEPEVDPPVQVETATGPRLASSIGG